MRIERALVGCCENSELYSSVDGFQNVDSIGCLTFMSPRNACISYLLELLQSWDPHYVYRGEGLFLLEQEKAHSQSVVYDEFQLKKVLIDTNRYPFTMNLHGYVEISAFRAQEIYPFG